MDRELLLEIGCEELPASWLPALTVQIGDLVSAQLREHRLAPDAPADTFSTPRRLTVWVARVPDRQTDLEEMVNGPPVSASFKPDGSPTPAAAGFAGKQGVEVSALERVTTAKGEYLAFRKRQRGKAAVDVLPDVLTGTLRGLAFPKSMHWDATLEDGRGDLLFGRPIRWILFSYGGRVVPFTITRTSAAQCGQVQNISSGAVTYGHRFLTTSGRAGRALKVKSFDEYRARLLENFVILERGARHDKIARELDAKAQRLKGRVSRTVHIESGLLEEVPDLVEYPSVVAGTFASEFTEVLPDEVLTTTLIHHQHYFPIEGDDGRLRPAFLAVVNTEPDNERTIARNAERVVTARLRDAMFFWTADRRTPLDARVDRLSTLLFHKKLGSYKDKAERVEPLAEWIAREAFGASPETATYAATAARLAKADLTTDMVRELTELQGIMGGIYAREDGLPEQVWKAIYFHYLPVGVEADARPTSAQLGVAAVTWAAVSLADKLDTIVGLFSAGEKPTGSRDPYGLRRAAHGVFKILVDLRETTGVASKPTVGQLVDKACEPFGSFSEWTGEATASFNNFLMDRFEHVLVQRGFDPRNIRAVTARGRELGSFYLLNPVQDRRLLEFYPDVVSTDEFQKLAVAFKRVRNLGRQMSAAEFAHEEEREPDLGRFLKEPAELELLSVLTARGPRIESALKREDYQEALREAGHFGPAVDKFFTDVLVMADDEALKKARLRLLKRLEAAILQLGDVSQILSEEKPG